ncbi:MAG: hypothetical protein WEA36_09465 [Balneolaceae bacterium]
MRRLVRYIVTGVLLLPLPLHAQFLSIQIDVEPDVVAQTVRPLDFGQIPTGSGEVRISLGDSQMGIFSIHAIQTQRLLVTLEQPEFLTHERLDARIPLTLQMAYTEFGINDFSQATPIGQENEEIIVQPIPGNITTVWSTAHLYVYGWLDIGMVPEGVYSGDVVLLIEYE